VGFYWVVNDGHISYMAVVNINPGVIEAALRHCGPAPLRPCARDTGFPELQGFGGTRLQGSRRCVGGNVDRNPVTQTPCIPCSFCCPATLLTHFMLLRSEFFRQ
jgi:hypothetical protein